MDLELSQHQREIRDRARDYARSVLAPQAADFERREEIPRPVFAGLADRGLLGVNVPVELGGIGAGALAYSLAMTEIAAGCASTAVAMSVTNMVGEVIDRFGTDAQKARFNPRLCRGELGAFALSEVDAGSDPGGMRTTARRVGDDWIISGSKQWITTGDEAGVMVVWARTQGEGTGGISCFLVESGTPSLTVARREDKMGLRASHTVALAFDDMWVPGDALLGSEDGGFRIAMMALDGGRIGIASQALGIAETAYRAARRHCQTISSEEQVSLFRLADIRTELDAARLLTWRAAWLKDQGQSFSREASMAKVWATEAAWRACNRAMEIIGLATDDEAAVLSRCLRDVRVTRIYEGTSEIQRLVIARHVLR